MNYILKNWIVKKGLFWYCSNYSTWKNNHNLHFFLNCFASSFFFSFQFWSVLYGTICQPLLWEPKHSRRSRGCPTTTFIDQRQIVTPILTRQFVASVMTYRQEWNRLIKSVWVHPNRQIDMGFNFTCTHKQSNKVPQREHTEHCTCKLFLIRPLVECIISYLKYFYLY